jgi:hypothetical protein
VGKRSLRFCRLTKCGQAVVKNRAASEAFPPAKNENYYVSINEDPPGYFIVCHGQYDPYNARPESAPAVCEISMISFNPSTTYGNGVLRRSRKPQFEDLCALQLLAQPYAGNAHVEARLFVHTPCCRAARVSAVVTGLRARPSSHVACKALFGS